MFLHCLWSLCLPVGFPAFTFTWASAVPPSHPHVRSCYLQAVESKWIPVSAACPALPHSFLGLVTLLLQLQGLQPLLPAGLITSIPNSICKQSPFRADPWALHSSSMLQTKIKQNTCYGPWPRKLKTKEKKMREGISSSPPSFHENSRDGVRGKDKIQTHFSRTLTLT